VTEHLPLDDVRVIDLTVARAGPTCVRQLADWGADVIRVEPPTGAEGPAAPGVAGDTRHGCDFQHLHRNKRSLSLDLKAPGAREVLMRLADTADVLIENMRPPVKDRLGFGFAAVHARNPRLVYGSISGFGQDGLYATRGGVDQIAQGMGGLMSVTGLPGTEPTRAGIPVSDLAAGLYLAVGVLVALHDRDRAGVPCGPVYRMDQVFADPQVEHLAMTEPVEHPALGRLDILRNAVRMAGTPGTVRAPSPDLGAHTDEVLTELGYPRAEIDRLRAQRVI
jgi:crotonobetainyl-CoA:carnitine CoA-transferase CaiB-like acyl-CoA transferase